MFLFVSSKLRIFVINMEEKLKIKTELFTDYKFGSVWTKHTEIRTNSYIIIYHQNVEESSVNDKRSGLYLLFSQFPWFHNEFVWWFSSIIYSRACLIAHWLSKYINWHYSEYRLLRKRNKKRRNKQIKRFPYGIIHHSAESDDIQASHFVIVMRISQSTYCSSIYRIHSFKFYHSLTLSFDHSLKF